MKLNHSIVLGALGALIGVSPLQAEHADRTLATIGFAHRAHWLLDDEETIRLSVWNTSKFFYIEAVIYQDNTGALGKNEDGLTGDTGSLYLDLDGNKKITPFLDRVYTVNLAPHYPDMVFQLYLFEDKERIQSSQIQDSSEALGNIRYRHLTEKRNVRVDRMMIPLSELKLKVGDKISLGYYADSPVPQLTVGTVTNTKQLARHFDKFVEFVLK